MTPAEIRDFRERHGLTGEEFGKLVEPPLSRHVVSALETGERPISAGMRARLRLAMARATAGEG
jgi:transcriptional regulator with XRE-family HTH domain